MPGTMSGGGKNVAKGRMGSRIQQDFSAKDMDTMEIDVKADIDRLEVRQMSLFWSYEWDSIF